MTGRDLSRRQFVGLTAAGAASAVSPSGCGMLRGAEEEGLVAVIAAPLLGPAQDEDAFRAAAAAMRAARVDVAVVPVADEPADSATALDNLLRLHRHAARLRDEIRVVSGPADLVRGGLRILPQLCGMGMVPGATPEEMLASIDGLRALGVQVVRPTHQWKNRIGDGCYERTDQRLTQTGRQAIRALQAADILIDLSGMGLRGSLEAMELASRPVAFTRSNAAHVHAHPANLTDEQIDVCARGGGVIGVSAFPALVSSAAAPALDDLLRHVDHIARRVGVEHVALGLDFDERPRKRFPSDPIPDPPYHYPKGLSRIDELDALRTALESHGYGTTQLRQIMGGNFVRVLRAAWNGTGQPRIG